MLDWIADDTADLRLRVDLPRVEPSPFLIRLLAQWQAPITMNRLFPFA